MAFEKTHARERLLDQQILHVLSSSLLENKMGYVHMKIHWKLHTLQNMQVVAQFHKIWISQSLSMEFSWCACVHQLQWKCMYDHLTSLAHWGKIVVKLQVNMKEAFCGRKSLWPESKCPRATCFGVKGPELFTACHKSCFMCSCSFATSYSLLQWKNSLFSLSLSCVCSVYTVNLYMTNFWTNFLHFQGHENHQLCS